VRDGIAAASRGLPAVALVTEKFWEQAAFVARSSGIADLPRLRLPYPIAGQRREVITGIASAHADAILALLRGGGGGEGEA
jgi:hypothetical protein